MNILVVEEEKEAAAYLRQGLTESGYSVEVALNGTDGLHAAANGDHDLVIPCSAEDARAWRARTDWSGGFADVAAQQPTHASVAAMPLP